MAINETSLYSLNSMKMLSTNKSFIILARSKWNNYFLNQQIRLNSVYTKIPKQFFRSTKRSQKLNKFLAYNQWTTNLPQNIFQLRCFSRHSTLQTSKVEPNGQKTTETNASTKELREDNEKEPIEPLGIAGLYKWEDMSNVKEWICLYHFPYIAPLRTFQRIKLWITVINLGLIPGTLVLYSSGSVELEVVGFYSMVGLFSMFATYFFGQIFSRFVGRIYVSNDSKFVRLSHLSFFGNRIDTDIDKEDVVPLMYTNNRIDDFYCGIERYSTSNQLYMSLKYGGIVNREAFEQVFGEGAIKFLNQSKR